MYACSSHTPCTLCVLLAGGSLFSFCCCSKIYIIFRMHHLSLTWQTMCSFWVYPLPLPLVCGMEWFTIQQQFIWSASQRESHIKCVRILSRNALLKSRKREELDISEWENTTTYKFKFRNQNHTNRMSLYYQIKGGVMSCACLCGEVIQKHSPYLRTTTQLLYQVSLWPSFLKHVGLNLSFHM